MSNEHSTEEARLAALLTCPWCDAGRGDPCQEWDKPIEHLHEQRLVEAEVIEREYVAERVAQALTTIESWHKKRTAYVRTGGIVGDYRDICLTCSTVSDLDPEVVEFMVAWPCRTVQDVSRIRPASGDTEADR